MVASREEPIRENLEQMDDSDAEECLSFCDLPIYDDGTASKTPNWVGDDDRRRLSTDQELFEFFSDLKADVCPADDIIFCGKLIPYKEEEKECCHEQEDKNDILDVIDDDDDDDGSQSCTFKNFFRRRRRRSDSMSGLERSQTISKDRVMRTSGALEYRKLQRVSSTTTKSKDPVKGKANCSGINSTSTIPAKPKWPLLMFGMVNVPKEMELKDIKNRQNRRNPPLFFPAIVGSGGGGGGGGAEEAKVTRETEKGSWRLLRALSCRGPACAMVTAS